MAKRVPKGEKIARKASVSGKTVWLVNHSVRGDETETTRLVYDRVGIAYSDIPDGVPAYVLIAAAASDWIVLQGQLRKMTEEKRLLAEGKTFESADIAAERVKVDDVTKAARMAAKLTPEEQVQALIKGYGIDEAQARRLLKIPVQK